MAAPSVQAAVAPLTPFATVNLAAATPTQLTYASGHCFLVITNTTSGIVYLSNLSTVGANATSFAIPAGQALPAIPVYGPTGIWVSAVTAGPLSVMVLPR